MVGHFKVDEAQELMKQNEKLKDEKKILEDIKVIFFKVYKLCY